MAPYERLRKKYVLIRHMGFMSILKSAIFPLFKNDILNLAPPLSQALSMTIQIENFNPNKL